MDKCKIAKADFCFIEAETKFYPVLTFDEQIDIFTSNDYFKYTIKNNFSQQQSWEFDTFNNANHFIQINAHQIRLKVNFDDLKAGKYTHRLEWTHNGLKKVVFEGTVVVIKSGSPCGCGCGDNAAENNYQTTLQNVQNNIYIGKNPEDMEALRITPEWRGGQTRNAYLYRFIEGIDTQNEDDGSAEIREPQMPARITKLNLHIENFASIADKNPRLIIERYTAAKAKGNGRRARFLPVKNRTNILPITSNFMQDVDFMQETYFKAIKNRRTQTAKTRGAKKPMAQNCFALFQLRIKTNEGTTAPLLRFKLQAGVHRLDKFENISQGEFFLDWEFFCAISYRIV